MKLAAALMVILVLFSRLCRAKCREPRDCNPTTIVPAEICNFHKVDGDLYRGGRPTCAGLAKLEALGVRTFIDLGGAGAAIGRCKAEAEARGMRFIRVKISLPQIILTGVSDKQLRNLFADMRIASKPIYVSCSLGRDRTGMVVAIYRIKRGEMSFDEARQEAIHYGYRPRFRGLRGALNRYQESNEVERLPDPSFRPAQVRSVCRASGGPATEFPARRFSGPQL